MNCDLTPQIRRSAAPEVQNDLLSQAILRPPVRRLCSARCDSADAWTLGEVAKLVSGLNGPRYAPPLVAPQDICCITSRVALRPGGKTVMTRRIRDSLSNLRPRGAFWNAEMLRTHLQPRGRLSDVPLAHRERACGILDCQALVQFSETGG